MPERIVCRRDLAFLLYDWLQVERLTGRPRYREHARETFEAALDAFLGAARNRTPATPGLDEGWQSLRVVAALTEAAVTGKRVAIASIPETSRAHV